MFGRKKQLTGAHPAPTREAPSLKLKAVKSEGLAWSNEHTNVVGLTFAVTIVIEPQDIQEMLVRVNRTPAEVQRLLLNTLLAYNAKWKPWVDVLPVQHYTLVPEEEAP